MSLFYFKNFNFSLTLLYLKQLYICQRNNKLKTNKMKQNLKDIGLAFILWGLFITAVLILTL